jgi:tRNA threonylcarbamoyladenosine biosynthesis protein TsaB
VVTTVRVLGLDTATRRASVGLLVDGAIAAEGAREDGRHATSLLPLIDEVLRAAGCAVGDLDGIAVSAGPGSFTGLRIGLSVAKGLAWAAQVPLVGVSTLEALVRTLEPRRGTVHTLLDARKGEIYAACFESGPSGWERRMADAVTTPEALLPALKAPCTILGDAVLAYGAWFSSRLGNALTVLPWAAYAPRGASVAELGAARLRNGAVTPLRDLEPYYARLPDAQLPSL